MTGFMVNVELPSCDPDAIAYMRNALEHEHNIYIVYDKLEMKPPLAATTTATSGPVLIPSPTPCYLYHTRLSAQVYLEMSDFEQLSALVPQLLASYTPLPRAGLSGAT
jgi:hypothetical protein